MNIDALEVAKFAQHAEHWWDPNGELKTLHDINPLRLGFILERTPLLGKKVLDVGCGGGILSESLAQQGAEVIGIDATPETIEAAKAHAAKQSNLNLSYKAITAEEMAQERGAEFDIVTCLELLEHVPDPQSLIHACAQLVKPGGNVFFSTLNRNPKAYLFAILGAEYFLKLLPRGTHDYAKFLRPSEVATFARKNDLQVQEFKGLSYNPLTKQYYLSEDISVNYLVHSKKSNYI